MDEIKKILSLQDGVIARRQALEAGLPKHAIARRLRRREWASVHPGVHVSRLDDLPWLHRRHWLAGILDDVAEGTCSVLEHGYLTLVERPHGLPRGIRQDSVTAGRRRMFRDVVYRSRRPEWAQIVELDGRLFHDSTNSRDQDFERDLDAAINAEHTVRIGYGQVFDRPCQTAVKVGRLLNRRGWRGHVVPCPDCAGPAECGA